MAITTEMPPGRWVGTRRLARDLWADKVGLFGVVVVSLIVLVAILAPLLAPHDPAQQSLRDRLNPPFWLEGGSKTHLLGTDELGRDVLSRIIFGARLSLTIGAMVVLVGGTIGTCLGMISGYKGGRIDAAIMRMVDVQLSFPGLLLALIVVTVVGPSFGLLITILSIDGWMVYARMNRGLVLSLKERPYVEAAQLVGARTRRVIFRHILPNLAAPLMTLAILEFARVVIAEAALSFIGLGIQPPGISWGLDIATGRDYIFSAWWLVTFPGIAIALTVLSLNLVASWLRIISDPQEREKRFGERDAARLPSSLSGAPV